MGAWATQSLSDAALHSWGWRVPFALGLLIGPVGLWIRRHMEETEAFVAASKSPVEPPASVSGVLRDNLRGVLVSMGQTITGTAVFYVMLVNMPTFVHKTFGLPLDQAFKVQMAAVALLTVTIPFAAPRVRPHRAASRADRRFAGAADGHVSAVHVAGCRTGHRAPARDAARDLHDHRHSLRRADHARRAVRDAFALHGHRARVQRRGDGVRRLRAVHRHAADARERVACRASAWYVLFAASFGLLASVFMHDGAPCVLARRRFQGEPLSAKRPWLPPALASHRRRRQAG